MRKNKKSKKKYKNIKDPLFADKTYVLNCQTIDGSINHDKYLYENEV